MNTRFLPLAWTLAMIAVLAATDGSVKGNNLEGMCSNLPNGSQPMVGAERGLPLVGNYWKNTKTLNVVFHDPAGKWVDTVKQAVRRNVKEWERYASIEFTFDDQKAADVRVQILPTEIYPEYTYQSWVGPECRKYAKTSSPSTWLIFPENTDDRELRRVILHEFAHVLGFIHELKRPDKEILWDDDEVVKYYAYTNWPKGTILDQVKATYKGPIADRSAFDIQSITVYPVKQGMAWDYDPITKEKRVFTTEMPYELSSMDKAFAPRLYPLKAPLPEEEIATDGSFHAGKISEGGTAATFRFSIQKDGGFRITLRPRMGARSLCVRAAVFGASEIEQTQSRYAAAVEAEGEKTGRTSAQAEVRDVVGPEGHLLHRGPSSRSLARRR